MVSSCCWQPYHCDVAAQCVRLARVLLPRLLLPRLHHRNHELVFGENFRGDALHIFQRHGFVFGVVFVAVVEALLRDLFAAVRCDSFRACR